MPIECSGFMPGEVRDSGFSGLRADIIYLRVSPLSLGTFEWRDILALLAPRLHEECRRVAPITYS